MRVSLENAPTIATPEQEQTPYSIPSIDWWITSRCNLACDFCYGPVPTKDPAELREAIACELAISSAETITFCGGEPLILAEEVFQYARLFKDNGKRVVLNTNGELFERAVTRFLRPGEDLPFDVVGLSIEGATREQHEKMRVKAELAPTFRAGLVARDLYGKSVKAATVVSQVNHQNLYQLGEFLRYELRPDVWRLYQYNPNGPAGINHGFDRHTISKEDYVRAIGVAATAAGTLPTFPSDNESQNCLIVDPNAELMLSTANGYDMLGNCFDDSISDIWERQPNKTRGMVAKNKRWLGRQILSGFNQAYPQPETDWLQWDIPSDDEMLGQYQNTLRRAQSIQKLVIRNEQAFKTTCLSNIPVYGMNNDEQDLYWRTIRNELLFHDILDAEVITQTVQRFEHYLARIAASGYAFI